MPFYIEIWNICQYREAIVSMGVDHFYLISIWRIQLYILFKTPLYLSPNYLQIKNQLNALLTFLKEKKCSRTEVFLDGDCVSKMQFQLHTDIESDILWLRDKGKKSWWKVET